MIIQVIDFSILLYHAKINVHIILMIKIPTSICSKPNHVHTALAVLQCCRAVSGELLSITVVISHSLSIAVINRGPVVTFFVAYEPSYAGLAPFRSRQPNRASSSVRGFRHYQRDVRVYGRSDDVCGIAGIDFRIGCR